MTFRGRVKNGLIVLDDPGRLPDGAEVEVRAVSDIQFDPTARPIWEEFDEVLTSVPPNELAKLPVDGAEHHDHYIYGMPKDSP